MEDEIKRKEKWRNSVEKYRDKYCIDKTIKNNNKSFKENQYDFIIYCHSSNTLKANSSIICDREHNIIKETYLGKKDYTYSFLSNISCDFKMLKERYNNYKNKNGKINIVTISNEDVVNKVLNLSVKVVKSKNIINFLEEYIKYIDIFNVFARRTKNDLELDELNFLKDVEIDKFNEASNKNNYSNIYI